MKILGLIPARGGSKGISQKNIKPLAGKELIRYTIEAGLASTALSDLVVSTDDEKIAEVSRSAGASVPFLRPASLATDQSPTLDTVIHALTFLQNEGQQYDAVCLLQPTCPFRKAKDINKAITLFKTQQADSLISVREVPHVYNPHWVFKVDETSNYLNIATGEKDIISRRQNLPKAYHRDGSIYITTTMVLLQQRSLYGQKISYLLIKDTPDINIDTMADWKRAELEIEQSK